MRLWERGVVKHIVCISKIYQFINDYGLHKIHIYMFTNAHMYMHIYALVGWVLANGPGDLGLIPGRVITMTQNVVLDST